MSSSYQHSDQTRNRNDSSNQRRQLLRWNITEMAIAVTVLVVMFVVYNVSDNVRQIIPSLSSLSTDKEVVSAMNDLDGKRIDYSSWEGYESDDEVEIAYLNMMRHAEKDPDSGTGLSQDGKNRVKYYVKCMNPSMPPSEILPKPVGNLMAQLPGRVKVPIGENYGLSERSPMTLAPLAKSIGIELHEPCKMTDVPCFLENMQSLLKADKTMLIAWEHKMYPNLLKLIVRPSIESGVAHGQLDRFKKGGVFKKFWKELKGGYTRWPRVCDAQSWKDPRFIKAGKEKRWFPYHSPCFDSLWQIKFVRRSKKGVEGDWEAVDVKTLQAGFGGKASSPCAEGLAPK